MERVENVFLAAGLLFDIVGLIVLAAGAIVSWVTGISTVAIVGGVIVMLGLVLCGGGLLVGLGPSLIKVLRGGPIS
ncbi:hypothetical protein [Mesorhizobium sp. 8]|uniref:hypothetical protein n=1 Tax=Mesorhizobium sp. 8 TaxID=2584466 RepID=UPI00111DF57F|nr:hypothetical protein [Mesorhizobium sp. 8]QDB99686.1 hypothetical protein FGU64_04290 [Mesorhizobium sp. 8]